MITKTRLTRQGRVPKPGIVHLGPGAFFRAFNAVYTDDVMAQQGGDWGIVAVSLRSPTARDQLVPQACAYTSVTLTAEGLVPRPVGAIARALVAPEDPALVVAEMADPAISIVSLTITEKGYCHEPATGQLNLDHPDIVHDLSHPDMPRSALGFIVAALAKRRDDDLAPFTVLSCDNLPSNGALVRQVVLEFAKERDTELAAWIEGEARFPATMVDRITPATTEIDVARLAEETGYLDPACVVHESFRQWVIEDDFAGPRPNWEVTGVQFVDAVDAHETMKLRCLNGTHSCLAYLGYLAGYETISQTVENPDFAAYCQYLWRDEILPTVQQPKGEDLIAYCATLLARYRDPAIRHRTWQIAMDGSQKLPQRFLGTIRDARKAGRMPKGLCLAVAAWMRYVGGVDEAGKAIDVRDPLAAVLKNASDGAVTGDEKVEALLAVEAVFGADLATDTGFREALKQAFSRLEQQGAKAAVKEFLGR